MKIQSLLILLSITGICFGQNVKKVGSINVESNFYLGSKFVIQGGILSDSNRYNDFNYTDTVSTIYNSAKLLKGSSKEYKIGIKASYPHPFQIGYLDTLNGNITLSHYFFVGNNRVSIKLGDLFKEKDVLNGELSKENQEYLILQNLYKKFVNKQTGEIYDLAGKLGVLKRYISRNPNSIVALWDLALNYYNVRREEDQRKILTIVQNFSGGVKNTKTFQALTNNIIGDLQLAKGNRMPNIFFKSNDSLLSVVLKNKYTLIDFWFSGCQPCLEQFDTLQNIYNKNKQKGFEIIGISTDSKKNVSHWKEVILNFNLTWIQYLDAGGVEAKKLYILSFPTNFLLDRNGKILKKDISTDDLALFLKQNLN
ncbi:MAG: TlpA disulfide reductase family protein [Ferruginibacter sp.]